MDDDDYESIDNTDKISFHELMCELMTGRTGKLTRNIKQQPEDDFDEKIDLE
jgi:hypothetical protein